MNSTFDFHGNTVRIVLRDGKPWFVANDVCATLGYVNPRKAVADHLDDDEKGVTTGDTLGGSQKLTIINESGLYALVLRSRKPEARKFAKWVTNEVLPSIRKTGSYGAQPATPQSAAKQVAAFHVASQAGSRLQEALFLELVKPESRMNGRMLVTMDDGNPRIKWVDDDAFVLPIDGFAAVIYDSITVSPAVLAQINAACTKRLQEMATPRVPRRDAALRQESLALRRREVSV